MSDQGVVTYQTGWDSSEGPPAVLLGGVVYCWWCFIGGVFEILGGGMYLGSASQAALHVSTPLLQLLYVLIGLSLVALGFGILRLNAWVYWGGWLASFALAAVSVVEIVRWVNGTTITTETVFFCALNLLFCLYNFYFLRSARKVLRFPLFKGSRFSAGMALCGIVLLTPALAITLFVNHINNHLTTPVLLLVYLLGSVVMIVMAFMSLRLQRWVWWGSWLWAIILTGLSIDVIVRQLTATSVDVEGIVFSVVNFLVVGTIVYYLLEDTIRKAVFRPRPTQALFSPRMLIGGLTLAALALVIYLLPGAFGPLPIAYSVLGMVMGMVVGLLPLADPTNRLMGFVVGLLLAFASFVARGGLLPYTKASSAIVVALMLVTITGIAILFRSRAWFVAMLLGAGTLYGIAEPLFQAAPSSYLAGVGLAFAGILLSFGLGYTVSSLLELELVPYTSKEAQPDPIVAFQTNGSSAPSRETGAADAQAKRSAQ